MSDHKFAAASIAAVVLVCGGGVGYTVAANAHARTHEKGTRDERR